ncbi:MAG: cytochrome b/b6 domain-containing protein [Cyanobium sp.]
MLRTLHGATALLVLLSWLSGLITYSLHDGRLGRLGWRPSGDWIDIHGTIGVLLWPLALLFCLYALSIGRARLSQPANAAVLIGLVLAVGSGKLMNEDWLRTGQLNHLAYNLHLLAWLLITATVLCHFIALINRGGLALARSMFQLKVRKNDQLRHWPMQVARWFRLAP